MLASGLFLFLFRKFNSSNIFVIVNYDNARSLNLTRLKRALGAKRSPVKTFYVLYSFCSIHTCFKETDKIQNTIDYYHSINLSGNFRLLEVLLS